MREIENVTFANLFATPLLAHVWADGAELNEQLKDRILEHARKSPSKDLTNVGGWHSETGRLEFCGQAGERLVAHMREMTEEATLRVYAGFGKSPERLNWTLHAWANVNAAGDFNKMHTHPGATWSGVYYVDTGSSDRADEGTPLHLSDPNPSRTSIFFPELSSSNVLIKPEPGLMILFPSYVPHGVLPHRGDRERISIAFNVRKEPFP
jgi:uncharacterized protein (TIGR02466 family)